jgi:hypothetical protein
MALMDLLSDFQIKQNSIGNLVAMMLTPMVRPMLTGNVPLFIINAPTERAGKTILAQDLWGVVLTGRPVPLMQFPSNEDEVSKLVLSLMVGGNTQGVIDNVPSKLDSAALTSLVTAREVGGRVLGKTQFVTLPNTITLCVTGNHIMCSAEIAKRACVIELQPGMDNPEMRSGFKFEYIVEAFKEHAEAVLAWLLDLVRAWVEAGCPRPSVRMGGFERWVDVVGGICEFAGFPILQNRDEIGIDMDADTGDIRKLVEGWNHLHTTEWVRAAELLPIAQLPDVNVWPHLFERAKSDHGKATVLGRILRQYAGRVVCGFKIERRGSGSERLYRLSAL